MKRLITSMQWVDFEAEFPVLAKECLEHSPSARGNPLMVSLADEEGPERYRQFITLIPGSRDGFPVMVV